LFQQEGILDSVPSIGRKFRTWSIVYPKAFIQDSLITSNKKNQLMIKIKSSATISNNMVQRNHSTSNTINEVQEKLSTSIGFNIHIWCPQEVYKGGTN